MANTKKPPIPLTTFSMRVSPVQMAKLDALRAKTLIPITEHIRRAIDLYTAKLERGEPGITSPDASSPAPSPDAAGNTKTPSPGARRRVGSPARVNYR